MSIGVMLFNPFNGTPRHPDDVKSDPQGILVWDGEQPLKASSIVTGTLLHYTIDTGKINHLQLDSMRRAIERTRHAHHTDLHVRINGQTEVIEVDWLKHFREQP